jgi:hypothetical protein
MDILSKELIDALKPLLGPLTPLLIFRELKELRFEKVSEMDDEAKQMFLEKLLTDLIFPIVSSQKRSVMRSLIISKLKFSSSALESENKKAFLDYTSSD